MWYYLKTLIRDDCTKDYQDIKPIENKIKTNYKHNLLIL